MDRLVLMTDTQKAEIYSKIIEGEKYSDIAKMYGVTLVSVSEFARMNGIRKKKKRTVVSKEKKEEILKLLETRTVSISELARQLELPRTIVLNLEYKRLGKKRF